MQKLFQKYFLLGAIMGLVGFVIIRVGFSDLERLARILVMVLGTIGGVQALFHVMLHGWRQNISTLFLAGAGFFVSAAMVNLNVVLMGAFAGCIIARLLTEKHKKQTAT